MFKLIIIINILIYPIYIYFSSREKASSITNSNSNLSDLFRLFPTADFYLKNFIFY